MTNQTAPSYDTYLTNLVLTALRKVERTNKRVTIPVHKDMDAVRLYIMINDLITDYPEAELIAVQVHTVH
jgi:hypothetical protein